MTSFRIKNMRIEPVLNKRWCWAKKHRYMSNCRTIARYSVPRGASGSEITLTRIAPRRVDDDNCIGGMKGIRDGIADALKINDGDTRIQWRYAQKRGFPHEYAVEVEIS